MILITVELVSARTGKREVLGKAEIYNDATGTPSRGNYVAKLYKRGENFGGSVWKAGRIEDFPRKRLLMWDLLFRVLRELVEDRNP